MRLYLDTSSAIKLYKEEKETINVESIIRLMLNGEVQISTSYLTIAELIRGLSKGKLDEKELRETEEDPRNYENKGLVFVPISNEIIDSAIDYVMKNKLFVADAIHLATALEYADVMITNDEQLLKKSLKRSLKGMLEIIKPSEL